MLRYLHLKKENKNIIKIKNFILEIIIAISFILIIAIILKFSNSYDNILLCSSLSEVGLSSNVCYGTINELRSSAFSPLWGYFLERNYFFIIFYTLFNSFAANLILPEFRK